MIDKAQYLEGLIESSLTKDIFYLDTIRNTKVIKDLLILLAYQIGQVVNYTDIAQRLGITRVTVKKYVDLLEKLFIIFTIRPFRSKRRDEIGLAEKVYFYDVGVRNALIGQFEPPNIRADLGHLFENYVIAECVKLNDYFHRKYELRYWRTKGGSEIDLVLVRGLEPVAAFEIKYSNGAVSSAFKDTYSLTPQLITSTNFVSILSQTFIQQR
jgi:predicted AAA+ superfamily ATPase